jgi:hypothetical protein
MPALDPVVMGLASQAEVNLSRLAASTSGPPSSPKLRVSTSTVTPPPKPPPTSS